MNKIILFIIFILQNNLSSQVKFKVIPDSLKIHVATPFTVKLEATLPNNFKYEFDKSIAKSDDYEIIDTGFISEKFVDEKLIVSRNLKLINFTLDSIKILPFKFNYTIPGDTLKYFTMSDTLLLSVLAIAIDSSGNIRDIKPPLEVPISWKEILEYVLIGVLIIAVVLLIIYFYKKRKNKPIFEAPKIILPPEEIAINSLNEIEKENYLIRNEFKIFYSKVTEVLRIYFESKYNFKAVEQTTPEIIYELNSFINDRLWIDEIKNLLFKSDLVKFAKLIPSFDEATKIIPLARKIITSSSETKNV